MDTKEVNSNLKTFFPVLFFPFRKRICYFYFATCNYLCYRVVKIHYDYRSKGSVTKLPVIAWSGQYFNCHVQNFFLFARLKEAKYSILHLALNAQRHVLCDT